MAPGIFGVVCRSPGVQDPSALPMQRAGTSNRTIRIPPRTPEELLDVSTRRVPSLLQLLVISNLGSIWIRIRSGIPKKLEWALSTCSNVTVYWSWHLEIRLSVVLFPIRTGSHV